MRFVFSRRYMVMFLIITLLPIQAPAIAAAREIQWFAGPWGPSHAAWKSGLSESLAAFEKENDVKVNVIFHPNAIDRYEKFVVAAAAGTPPDVISITELGFMPQQGLLSDLTGYVQRSQLVGFKDYPPELWPRTMIDNIVYSVPAEAIPNLSLFYHKGIFDESGLPYIPEDKVMNWDEIWQITPKLNRFDADGRLVRLGIEPLSATGGSIPACVLSFGVQFLDAYGRPMVNTPEWKAIVDNMVQPYWYYGASAVRALGGWSNRIHEGKVGMQINGPWVAKELATYGFTSEIGNSWLPQQQGIKSQNLTSWMLAIPERVKDMELSWKFVEWFCGGEGAKTRAKAEATPFVGPSSRPDPQLLRLNPSIQWFVRSISDAEVMLAVDANPLWAEAQVQWKNMVLNPVADKAKLAIQALEEFQQHLENFLDN
jgi:ABC-type glycerol-3-phosphate transport system substrate-binding protein